MTKNDDNPFDYDPTLLAEIDTTSGKMYDDFFDLLATYQFDFTREEKAWMLNRIVKEISEMNNDASNNGETLGTGWGTRK